jgi:hypothetical protein
MIISQPENISKRGVLSVANLGSAGNPLAPLISRLLA